MRRGSVVVVAALVLGGCASVEELRQRAPEGTFATAKPAESVAECIRDGWESQKFGGAAYPVASQKSGDRYTVVSPNNGAPIELADVEAGHVSYFVSGGVFAARKARRLEALQRCL